jgi:anti-sigma regulatory factor (Ser/Thr protein kinase)
MVTVREYGFDAAPRPTERGRPSLLVLTAPPPAALAPTMRIILHDALLEGEGLHRLAREAGVPVPVLPPVPARDARRLRDLLATRGVRSEVHPLGLFKRMRLVMCSMPSDLEEGIARALAFAARAGIAESELPSLGTILREALANAALHGNREDPGKEVRLDLVLVGTLLTLAIEDEGAGFDHAAAMNELARTGDDAVARAEERAAAGRRGGLGLLLIRRWADALEWERDGRRVRIVKQLNG